MLIIEFTHPEILKLFSKCPASFSDSLFAVRQELGKERYQAIKSMFPKIPRSSFSVKKEPNRLRVLQGTNQEILWFFSTKDYQKNNQEKKSGVLVWKNVIKSRKI